MKKKPKKLEIDDLAVEDRIKRASSMLHGMINDLLELIRVHENNRLVVYSGLIADQIPRSFAANAFNTLVRTMHQYEVIRLCAFWDPIELGARSLPHVSALVGPMDVRNALIESTKQHWLNHHDEYFAISQARKVGEQLDRAKRATMQISASDRLWHLMQTRHKRLAHGLMRTRAEEKTGKTAIFVAGTERSILRSTIRIVDLFHLAVTGTSFDFNGSREMFRRNSEALWKGVTVNVTR